jgi:hypothetical protein
MDIDADDYSKERIPLFGMDVHVVQMVVVKNPVVANLLIFPGASRHGG